MIVHLHPHGFRQYGHLFTNISITNDSKVLATRRAAADLIQLLDAPAAGLQDRCAVAPELLQELHCLVGVWELLHAVDAVDTGGSGCGCWRGWCKRRRVSEHRGCKRWQLGRP